LKAGQQTSVSGAGSAPEPPKTMSAQDYGTWQNALKAKDLNKSLKLLESVPELQILGSAMNGEDALEAMERSLPEVI
ncbi:MAG TPA: hypothetical protein PKV70_01820, partial [Thermodesulfobacteriota bacterium]|nr:hypothetical protein [Thermodesulfobacteriota bacterium]